VISYKALHKTYPGVGTLLKNMQKFSEYEFEEEQRIAHLRDLLEFHVGATLYNAIYEGAASELAGRMTSMDNATRNAGDLIKRLTIKYNRGRQAAITTELTEIISGAAALG